MGSSLVKGSLVYACTTTPTIPTLESGTRGSKSIVVFLVRSYVYELEGVVEVGLGTEVPVLTQHLHALLLTHRHTTLHLTTTTQADTS